VFDPNWKAPDRATEEQFEMQERMMIHPGQLRDCTTCHR
jgi:hypothetical protein